MIDHSPAHSKGIRKVVLTADAPTAQVRLKIGPKPSELKFDVKDKLTGKAIDWFGVRWIAVDDSRLFSLDSQTQRTLIPPGTDVIVEVHATGYKRWFFIDPSDPSRPTLRLEPGEVRELQIELEPLAKN